MEPLSSAFWAAFLGTRKSAELRIVDSTPSPVLEDETYCEGSKALALEDVQDGGWE